VLQRNVEPTSTSGFTIDMRGLSRGVYFLKIKSRSGDRAVPVVKE
jgi:hypothetical protein